jgi:hypothetical protein
MDGLIAVAEFSSVFYGQSDTAVDISVPSGLQIQSVCVISDTSSVGLDALFKGTEILDMAEGTLF